MRKPGQDQTDASRRLAAINRAITTSLNFDKVLDLIVDNACELVDADVCLVLLLNQEERLTIRAAKGVDPDVVREFSGRMEEDVLRGYKTRSHWMPANTWSLFPSSLKQVLNGLLVVSRDQPLDEDERWQLSALADQAAIALRNAQLYEMELAEAVRAREASQDVARRLGGDRGVFGRCHHQQGPERSHSQLE